MTNLELHDHLRTAESIISAYRRTAGKQSQMHGIPSSVVTEIMDSWLIQNDKVMYGLSTENVSRLRSGWWTTLAVSCLRYVALLLKRKIN